MPPDICATDCIALRTSAISAPLSKFPMAAVCCETSVFRESHADSLGNSAPLKQVPPTAAGLAPVGTVGAGAALFCGAEFAGLVPAHAEFASIGRDRATLGLVSSRERSTLVS